MITARTMRQARVFDRDCLDCSVVSRNGTPILARRNMILAARVAKAKIEEGHCEPGTGFAARVQEIVGAGGTLSWR